MLCPRCHQAQEDGPEECRHCGVIFSRSRPSSPSAVPPAHGWLFELLLEVPPCENPAMVAARGFVLLALALASLHLLALPIRGPALMGSFLHWIDLPFHEAGHLVFMPFGEFLHILGGTLGQLLVPLLVAGAFLRQANLFGAAVGTWWLGQSCLDCAPYIADANARLLLLTTGETGQTDWESHDWYQLLSRTGNLAHDLALARLFWLAGAALMLAALAWAGFILVRQWRPMGARPK